MESYRDSSQARWLPKRRSSPPRKRMSGCFLNITNVLALPAQKSPHGPLRHSDVGLIKEHQRPLRPTRAFASRTFWVQWRAPVRKWLQQHTILCSSPLPQLTMDGPRSRRRPTEVSFWNARAYPDGAPDAHGRDLTGTFVYRETDDSVVSSEGELLDDRKKYCKTISHLTMSSFQRRTLLTRRLSCIYYPLRLLNHSRNKCKTTFFVNALQILNERRIHPSPLVTMVFNFGLALAENISSSKELCSSRY